MVFKIIFSTKATFKIDSQGSSKQQILIASMENQYLPVTINLLQSTYALVQNVRALIYERKIRSFDQKNIASGLFTLVVVVVVMY